MKSLQRAARNSNWGDLCSHTQALMQEDPASPGVAWMLEISKGKKGQGKIISPPYQKATVDRTTQNRIQNSECPSLRLVDSASL